MDAERVAVTAAVALSLAGHAWAFLTVEERRRVVDWLVWIVVSALVLAGIVTAVARQRKAKPKCACFEFVGDNPYCPIEDHRSTARVWQKIGRSSGRNWGKK